MWRSPLFWPSSTGLRDAPFGPPSTTVVREARTRDGREGGQSRAIVFVAVRSRSRMDRESWHRR
eukprot:9314545-Alexandrium_andersonii.AAC.1